MPELGEVAHAVALLRKHLLGATIARVAAPADDLLYVRPLTHDAFRQAAEGASVTGVGRNGKYFMLELAGARTLVLHFGMTGWIHVRNVGTLIRMEGGGDKRQKALMEQLAAEGKDPTEAQELAQDWPPRFTKFELATAAGTELAFIDPRRLARVRLLDAPLGAAARLEPLSKLGTDFSQAQPPAAEVLPLILRRKVPVKSLLLDQTLFSGVGNWMADEILYQARLHPEQYADTLGTAHATRLYESLLEVCRVAAETEGNSAAFPKHWLMLHRWGKSRSKKEVQKTAEGHIVSFVKVGGRTSCYVPTLQKKFSAVKDEDEDEDEAAADGAAGGADESNADSASTGAGVEVKTETVEQPEAPPAGRRPRRKRAKVEA